VSRHLETGWRTLRRWACDPSASAASDFAVLLPVMLALFMGGYESTNLILTYRKVCDASTQLANIVSQLGAGNSGAIDSTDVQTAMAAVTQVMYPYPTSPLTMTIVEINVAGNGTASMGWHDTYSNGVFTTNSGTPPSPLLPTALNNANIATIMNTSDCGSSSNQTCYSYLWVSSSYTYQSSIGGNYVGWTIPLGNSVYVPPRDEEVVNCTGC
jgi:Flp pilus assembly protein TadG